MNDKTYTLELTEQEILDVVIGIEWLVDQANKSKFKDRTKCLRKLWNKIIDVYEERT